MKIYLGRRNDLQNPVLEAVNDKDIGKLVNLFNGELVGIRYIPRTGKENDERIDEKGEMGRFSYNSITNPENMYLLGPVQERTNGHFVFSDNRYSTIT